MSDILIKKLDGFSTFKLNEHNKSILNQNSANNVNFDDFFEISHLLDSSFMNYKVDKDLNIILLGKR